jgi:hypothetical protein
MSLGTRHIDDALTFYVTTTRFDTGAATDADSPPTYRVYEDETSTPILTGTMALLDSSNTAGLYSEGITLSAANGFEVGKSYGIYITAAVNSVTGATQQYFRVSGDAYARLGAPAGASVSADIAVIEGQTDDIGAAGAGLTAVAIGTGGITRASFAADTGLQSVRSNTAAAGGASTITLDASASATNDFYNGMSIYLTGGTGAGQSNTILDYVGGTQVATVKDAWVTTPDNTTTFAIFPGAETSDDIADAILLRDWTDVVGTVPDRSTLNALRFLRNKWSLAAGTLTVTEEDDTTSAWTASVTTDAGAVPIIGSDPA